MMRVDHTQKSAQQFRHFRHWVVVGLGVTAASVKAYHATQDLDVTLWGYDDNPVAVDNARTQGWQLLDSQARALDHNPALVVVSPGIASFPGYCHPFVEHLQANQQQYLIISDLDLWHMVMTEKNVSSYDSSALRVNDVSVLRAGASPLGADSSSDSRESRESPESPKPPESPEPLTIGVTGTNGKSTVSSMISHMSEELLGPTALVGNIGKPPLAVVVDGVRKDVWVMEISSFQLELTSRPLLDAAVLLNISPDHLDRYGSMEGYITTKLSIIDIIKTGGMVFVPRSESDVFHFVAKHPRVVSGCVRLCGVSDETEPSGDLDENVCSQIKRGALPNILETNRVIAQAVMKEILMGRGKNIPHTFYHILDTFASLPHRCALVAPDLEEKTAALGVQFINDSKATNFAAAARSVQGYEEVYWLVGGQIKTASDADIFSSLLWRIHCVYGFGESGFFWGEWCAKRDIKHKVFATLKEATNAAGKDAIYNNQKNKRHNKTSWILSTVLLSPGGSSFDAFSGFADRGRCFEQCVYKLLKTPAFDHLNHLDHLDHLDHGASS